MRCEREEKKQGWYQEHESGKDDDCHYRRAGLSTNPNAKVAPASRLNLVIDDGHI